MRVACLDETAAKRVELQKAIDKAYDTCRQTVGHLTPAQTYPVSTQELVVNAAPDIVVVGPSLSIEAAYSCCKAIRKAHPDVSLCIMLRSEYYSLRSLRRFEKVTTHVFSVDDPPIRIVHELTALSKRFSQTQQGKLITVEGVKGGVGATSIVTGLAHAAQAIGKSAVALDLSSSSALIYYMTPDRTRSADLSAALVDKLFPDNALIERCITTAPNGVVLLLPPSGGTEIRELWLRDAARFEIMLSILDVLSEQFDLILIDIAGVEGVLPFALTCRAQTRLLVSSNDPASVHLLSNALTVLIESPGDGDVQILLNMTSEHGLSEDDVLDFLYCNKHFSQEMTTISAVPFDSAGGHWIGTGNTFYTESGSKVQHILEEAVAILSDDAGVVVSRRKERIAWWKKFRRFTQRPRLLKSSREQRLALPMNTANDEPEEVKTLLRPKITKAKVTEVENTLIQESEEETETETVYEPPKLAINE